MQLVIDIPEKIYNDIRTKNEHGIIFNAVKNGTPLPKRHGRLIDADDFFQMFEELDMKPYNDAPTVIEADTEGSEAV